MKEHIMISLKRFVLTLALVFFAPIAAQAADKIMFDAGQFAKAQADNQSIMVIVTAPWCPTCKAQKPILDEVTGQPSFKNLKIFEVDFDTRKDVLRDLKVTMQSTLIIYKGKTEMGRSTGDTKKESIETLVNKSL
jgi:thioredoxin 1